MPNSFFSSTDLNPAQRTAVESIDGPVLIIAGPGSGKTKTLVDRIVYLIAAKNVPSENILVATFTEKAAKELITRVTNRASSLGVPVNLADMYIGTLHGIFLRILEEHRADTRLLRNYRVLDQFEQAYMVFRELPRFRTAEGYEHIVEATGPLWTQAERIVSLVNTVSEESLNPEELQNAPDLAVAALGRLVTTYRALLAEENVLDFSTIQTETLSLLVSHPEVLTVLRSRLRYLMIDEYQDTNTIQERILLLLAAPANRICVVGDDDQGLYRFRGATIRNILEFPKNFPGGDCTRIELVTNYRSHPGIIDFYNRWMDDIPDGWFGGKDLTFRYPKTIRARDADFSSYPAVVKVSGTEKPEAWHDEVVEFISSLHEGGSLSDYNQIAFLFRSVKGNAAIGLAKHLESKGIKVFSPRSALFFEREEIKLMIGALIFMVPDLFTSHLPLKNDLTLDVWEYYKGCFEAFAAALRADPEGTRPLREWCVKKARTHTPLVANTDYAFALLFYEILQFPLFSRYLDTDFDTGITDLRPLYNLSLLSQLLVRFEFIYSINVFTPEFFTRDLKHLFNDYLRFLYEGGIVEYEDFDEYAPSGCVSFMTIHQAKGLEFPVVFVDSINTVPRKDYEELDEILRSSYLQKRPFEPIERIKYFDFWRLFYTAFSRPQNLLCLTGAEKEGHGPLPSKYFKKAWDSVPSWRDASFDSSTLQLPPMKAVDLKHDYSFTSHILVFENCPRQYKFFKEAEFAPVRTNAALFGSVVHETIEDVHRTVLEGKPETVTAERVASWFETNYRNLSKSTHTYLAPPVKIAALRQVNNYVDHASSDWSILREAEVMVSLLKEEYILRGKIDLIRGEADTVEILDFKTEKKPDVNEAEDRQRLERYRRQLDVYAHIIEEKYGYKVSKMHLYYTSAENETPYVTYPYDKDAVQRTIGVIDGVVAKIEDKDFALGTVKKTKKLCGNCDLRLYCWEKPD